MSTTTALLTAGGSGTRMQNNIPKQFITVNEIPIIVYTLQKFQNSKHVDKIIIACIEEWQTVLRAYSSEFNISKLEKIVIGGATGIESIRNCFNNIKNNDENDIIIIHDGNRPLVDDDIIRRNIEAAKETGATTTYIDIHDGIVKIDDTFTVVKSDFKREHIKITQTPHCFKSKTLNDILPRIKNANKYISLADAATSFGYATSLVKGSELNFKITTPNDLTLFETIINTDSNNV